MQLSKSLHTWRIVLIVTFLLVPLSNYIPILFDWADGRFNDDPNTLIDAAGYGFSIWGIIFIGMILFSIFQFKEKHESKALLRATQALVAAGWASIAFVPISLTDNNVLGWFNIMWHLAALIAANRALRVHASGNHQYGWTYFAPSLYLGWISAATVISTTYLLIDLGVSFPENIAIIVALLLIVTLAGIGAFLLIRRDGFYGLTVAWALVAVGVEQSQTPLLQISAFSLAGLLIVMAAIRGFQPSKDFFYAT